MSFVLVSETCRHYGDAYISRPIYLGPLRHLVSCRAHYGYAGQKPDHKRGGRILAHLLFAQIFWPPCSCATGQGKLSLLMVGAVTA